MESCGDEGTEGPPARDGGGGAGEAGKKWRENWSSGAAGKWGSVVEGEEPEGGVRIEPERRRWC